MTHGDIEQIHHVARLAFLAMSARAVAADAFEADPSLHEVVFRVGLPSENQQPPIDVEFVGAGGMPVGGMSL